METFAKLMRAFPSAQDAIGGELAAALSATTVGAEQEVVVA
jgi:hypothetical protein